MHPAYSVIIFTTSSGAGYGLLFWLSLGHAFGMLPDSRWLVLIGLILALALITVGLIASTLHLGHPERAVGAFSQWRSSWLSREGVAAVATYMPSGLLALMMLLGIESALEPILALLSAVGAVVTVYCTGMIYGSLRTIRQWSNSLTPIVYLSLAAATGSLLLAALTGIFGYGPVWIAVVVVACFGAAGFVKMTYWRQIDADPGQYTAEMATGLGRNGGTVRPLDPPHTRPNFVMREMGYQVARDHAMKLRQLTLATLFAAPLAIGVLCLIMSSGITFFYLLAAIAAGVGVVTERWLFFAEAEHVSQLFYGAARA